MKMFRRLFILFACASAVLSARAEDAAPVDGLAKDLAASVPVTDDRAASDRAPAAEPPRTFILNRVVLPAEPTK